MISTDEIIKLYTFDALGENLEKVEPLIVKEECMDSRCPEKNGEYSPRLSQNGKEVLLDLKAKNISSLLEHCCIANEYCYTERGMKVVIINNITLKKDIRGNKILSKIIERQKRFYRKKNFSRIVLTATNNGLVVWYRLGFKYLQKRDELKILKSLNEYLKDVHKITTRYKSIKEVEAKLLYNESKTENFTDWLIRHKIDHIKMIMEL
jgi:hypothetical protein